MCSTTEEQDAVMADMSEVLSELARAIARDPEQPLPKRLCRATVDILDMGGGSIVLGRHPQRMLMCATDDAAFRLDEVHEVLGEGPAADAYDSGHPVTAVLRRDATSRWPMFGDAAVEIFGAAVTLYALPMRAGRNVLGMLTLYQRGDGPVVADLSVAQILADAAGAALLHESESQDLRTWGPWAERARIDQATGVVIAQLGIPPEDAHALLRAHAYAHDTTIAAIAADVIERRLDFTNTDVPDEDQP
jgi:hypothetical protein